MTSFILAVTENAEGDDSMTDVRESLEESTVCRYSGGAGVGQGGLTWAQQFMLEAIIASGAPVGHFDIFVVCDIASPLPVSAATDVLRRFILRHPGLRTTISVTDGAAPAQRISADGTLSIPVHRMDDSLTSEPGDLRDLVSSTTFGSVFRALFAVRGESVIRIAMRICHLAADADAGQLLRGDLAVLAAGPPEAGPGDSVSLSPLDLCRFEESSEGRRVQRRSLDHAAAIFDVAPPAMFPCRRVSRLSAGDKPLAPAKRRLPRVQGPAGTAPGLLKPARPRRNARMRKGNGYE